MVKHSNGTGFIWMADTVWQLPQKSNKKDVNLYLNDRKEKGFTVVLISIAEHTGIKNSYTMEPAFHKFNWKKPNENYWKHVDYIITEAEKKGLYVGLLPAWHMFFERKDTKGLIDTGDAEHYGNYIASRYKDKKNIIWVIGGDSAATERKVQDVWNALGNAINKVVKDNHLITYHPTGAVSSSEWFHEQDWLDFNTLQSGHCADMQIGINNLRKDYEKKRIKPTLDNEPRYETMEECFYYPSLTPPKLQARPGYRFKDKDVREIAYKQIFSGAFGHTYGHHSIWQMSPKENLDATGRVDATVNSWKEALNAPGSIQMGYIVKLMKSREILSRVPDQSIILSEKGYATRGEGYAFIYLPEGGSLEVNMTKISGNRIKASWFDPRNGETTDIETIDKINRKIFDTSDSKDMVLILDDVSKKYKNP
jgi:hypothetical protein